ncbi:MAG TPA: trehalase family glycosidase, partial [bacterium]
KVEKLPAEITPAFAKSLEGKHGLLTLKLQKSEAGEISGVPFVVPGGRFNEMYGWDSYFEALGLLQDGRIDLAKALVDNFIYEIEHYGKILNANRSYYLTRSQPPFLTSMALSVYEALPQNDHSKEWLKMALRAAIQEYHTVWMNKDRLTETGLSRYYGSGIGVPPEVEPDHFDEIFQEFADKHHFGLAEFKKRYKAGEINDAELDAFFRHDRAVRESGHDTTYRWRRNGDDRGANFVTVDLNSLLYKYEIDIAYILKEVFDDAISSEKSGEWAARAQGRKALLLKYLWNDHKKMFFDYDFVNRVQSDYISATTFYPLWAWRPHQPETRILDEQAAERCIHAALSHLESNGGVLSTAQESRERYGIAGLERQWDYPFGWAPHQILIWQALRNYGQDQIAGRLIYKWLYTIVRNAENYNGTIPEKYNVVTRSHKVFAEYGNVGTEFSYMTREGFGWMNASYQIGLNLLSGEWRASLEKLVPPEWVDFH